MGNLNNLWIILCLGLAQNCLAQVGIGTTNPNSTTLLHIDNTAPLPAGQTVRPANALEVEGKTSVIGNFQLKNGTEGSGKILISDSEGNATWSDISNLNPKYLLRIHNISNNITNNAVGININTSFVNLNNQNTNLSSAGDPTFTLPKGSYKITFIISWQRTNNQNATYKFSLKNNVTNLGSFDAEVNSNLKRIEYSFTFGTIGNENLSINLRRITNSNPNVQIYDSFIYIEKL